MLVTASGSTTQRQLNDRFADVVNVKDYGAMADGVTDDRAAIAAAIAVASASGGRVYFPPGTYLVGSAFTIPSSVILQGAGKERTTLKRGFTGDLITSQASFSALYDLTIDGDTATRGAGRGIIVAASSSSQAHVNVVVKNFVEAALEFGTDGGSNFVSLASKYYTTGTVGVVAAVKGGATTSAVPRSFFGTASDGCTLFDFGQANHWYASGFFTNGLIFSDNTAFNVELRQFRAGSLGGTITVKGNSHYFSGVSSVAWILDSSVTASFVDVQAPNWDITDNGTNNSVSQITGGGGWTPTWTAATSGTPAVGTGGSLTGRYSRRGAWVRIEIALSLGTGFATGTGSWEFSIPAAAHSVNPVQVCGTAYMANAAGKGAVGAVQIATGASVLRVKTALTDGTFGTVDAGSFGPFTWDAGSTLRLSCEYRVP
jgi:hypothetical protein